MPYYKVFLGTDAQDQDTGHFITEVYHHVTYYLVTENRMLMLALGDNNFYWYNLDHLRSYRISPDTYEPVLVPGVSEPSVVEFPRPKK